VSRKKRKNKQKATPKVARAKKTLTLKQARFAAALMKTRTRREAAIIAGYSRKNIDQSANQAYNALLIKAPEAMGQAGLPLPVIIEKHLVPLLNATEVKLAQHEGQFTDYVELEALGIRLAATRMALELLAAFHPEDPALAAKTTVDVIIMDMPRPQRPEIDVTPTNGNKQKELANAKASAGPVKDPRPRD
jgi:hypothetical protein